MRRLLCTLPVAFLALAAVSAERGSQAQGAQQTSLTGRWTVSADGYGTPLFFALELSQEGNQISGKFAGDKLEGTFDGNALRFLAKDERGGTEKCDATLIRTRGQPDTIVGTLVFTGAGDSAPVISYKFTAKRVPQRRAGPARRHDFIPTTFYRQFSAANKPVLTIWPGDTVHTVTVDAGGTDEKGTKRVLGGNPQTGPFYVETAAPGDTLVVHLARVRLNRNWAISDDGIVERGLSSDLAVKTKDLFKDVRWHLDIDRGVATPEAPAEHLAHYSVPLRPMLGCVATAPSPVQAAPGTGDSGRYGGNMDFNEIVEGATIFLPVNVPGALLYLGDGHAVQGDGELTGNALETSMEVEFGVDVIPGKRLLSPRVESASHIMAMGLGGSLVAGFRAASNNMAQWLTDLYKLTPSEVAQVLGTAAEYKVSEVADRNAGIVLKINKERLQGLK